MISIHNLAFAYPRSEFELKIDGLEIEAGEKIAIVGPSGSGKTTLLNLISGIAVPDSGSISVLGQAMQNLSDKQRRDFRISKIGMVFQRFELVDYLNATDNMLLPYFVNQTLGGKSSAYERSKELARRMGLSDKMKRFPSQLSQGEQQRVAICRALVTDPDLLLADEPTGNLDPTNKQKILQLMFDACNESNRTLAVVTHDMNILDGFNRIVDFEQFRQRVQV